MNLGKTLRLRPGCDEARLRRKVGQPILAAAGFPAGWSGLRVKGGAGSKAGCRQDCLPHNSLQAATILRCSHCLKVVFLTTTHVPQRTGQEAYSTATC
jgi:hypothetical protein